MRIHSLILIYLTCVIATGACAETTLSYPQVKVETTEGTFVIELDAVRAPITARHFLDNVESGYYTGTVFHRVIRNFMAQAGGYDIDYKLKETDVKIPNESGNGLSNTRGTVAMARTKDPHSANTQFFVNVTDNSRLDPAPERWGYAVFGTVISGLDVIDLITNLPTGPNGPFDRDCPAMPIIIKKMTNIGEPGAR